MFKIKHVRTLISITFSGIDERDHGGQSLAWLLENKMKKVLFALLTVWVWTFGVEDPTLCNKHSEMHVDCISSAIWLRRPHQFEIILNAGHRGHTSELCNTIDRNSRMDFFAKH